MSRITDRLAAVLQLRGIREDQARAASAGAEAAAARAAGELRAGQLAARAATRPPEAALDPAGLQAWRLRQLQAQESLAQADDHLGRARSEVEHARAELTRASVRRKATERLRDRRGAHSAHAASVAAQRSLDELVLILRGRA